MDKGNPFFAINRGTLFFLTVSMKLSTVNHEFDTLFFYIKTFLFIKIFSAEKLKLNIYIFFFFFLLRKRKL